MFEEEKAAVRRWLELNSGSDDEVLAAFRATMSPEMTWTLIGSTPVSGTHRGLDAVQNTFFATCFSGDGRHGSGPQGLDPDYGVRLNINEVTALEDGRVMVHCTSDGRGKNGVPYKNEYCWLLTVKNGKIASMYEFADTALIERAMFDKKVVPAEKCPGIPG